LQTLTAISLMYFLCKHFGGTSYFRTRHQVSPNLVDQYHRFIQHFLL
jgi:hypothetical protein